MSRVQFELAPSKFKKVKTVSARISDLKGVLLNHDVSVYMCQAGSPTFTISVPKEYENAWNNHRSKESAYYGDRIGISEHWLHNASFDGALKDLEALSFNYKRHIESVTVRKVIQIRTVLIAPGARISHNKPSFDSSRVLVGVRSEIFWEVNGALYIDDRRGMIFDDEPEGNPEVDPTFDQLRPSGHHVSGGATVIPFTVEAWKTIQEVEATLERAAVMLHQLTKADTAQALLASGALALIGQSRSPTAD